MKTVVKLTHQSVIGEIESVLDTYPYHPYQQAFAIPDLRQELILFVLNQIPAFSSTISEEQIAIDSEKDSAFKYKLQYKPLEQQIQLQNLIHQGIYTIIQAKSDWLSNQLCKTVEVGCEPSCWFG
jgi:hypothetical protein